MVDRRGVALRVRETRIRENKVGKRIEPFRKVIDETNIMHTVFAMFSEGKTLDDVRHALPEIKHGYLGELRRIWLHLQKMENGDEEDRDVEFDWNLHLARDAAYVGLLMAHGGHPVCTGHGLIGKDGLPWRYRKPAERELAEFRKLQIRE